MRYLAIFLLAWPMVATAVPPEAKIRGEKSIIVSRGSTFALDARESISEEDLIWDFEKGYHFEYELVSPTGGKKGSILIVKGDLPARTYRFGVNAKDKPKDQAQQTSRAYVDVTVVENHGRNLTEPEFSTLVSEPFARILGPTVVMPGSDLVLDARMSRFDHHEAVEWVTEPKLNYELIGPADAPRSMLLVRNIPAGTFIFSVMVRGTPTQDGKSKTDEERHEVTATATPVTMFVEPELLVPTPIGERLFVSVVVGPELRFLGQKVGLAGYDVHRSEELFNFRYNAYDKTSQHFASKKLRPYLDGFTDLTGKVWPKIEGPALIIQDKVGRVILAEQAPNNGTGVIAKIVELRLR